MFATTYSWLFSLGQSRLKHAHQTNGARMFPIVGEYRKCPHGYHHPPWPHSCDGCWCEGERDRRDYGWPHDTTPKES